MSKASFKEFVKTPKGKLVLALCAMLLSWVFLLFSFSSSLMIALPSQAKKNALRQEISKIKLELAELNEKKLQADRLKARWKDLASRSWQPARDGDPELLLRQKIEAASKKSELKLNNLGTVRLTRINQDFGFAELDISATTRLSQLAAFILEIQKEKPAISWKRLSVFSMMRRRNNNNNRTVTDNTNEDNLMFNASLRVLVFYTELPEEKTSAAPKNGRRSARTRKPVQTETANARMNGPGRGSQSGGGMRP
ncbi:MAG: hypothetical protein IJS14_13560 [Lentisphaeria bacterium]|nr:hypothetical protein [Lentisphaeria bacterium]